MALQDDEMLKLDADDVTVVTIDPDECECSGVKAVAVTHVVMFDMRANGSVHEVFRGCATCATDFANRLKSSLPSPTEESAV